MNIYVAHSGSFDYINELYEPIKTSNIVKNHKVFLPHDKKEESCSKEIIQNSQLLIAEVTYHSTGMGIELGWAESANVPILCVYKKGKNYPSSLKYITNNFIEYVNEVDLLRKLEEFIKNMC